MLSVRLGLRPSGTTSGTEDRKDLARETEGLILAPMLDGMYSRAEAFFLAAGSAASEGNDHRTLSVCLVPACGRCGRPSSESTISVPHW
jgi:hypothetical protein